VAGLRGGRLREGRPTQQGLLTAVEVAPGDAVETAALLFTQNATDKADGLTVLVSIHTMHEAARCGRIVYLSNGKLVVRGTPN